MVIPFIAAGLGIAGVAFLLQSKPGPLPTEAEYDKAQLKLRVEPNDPDALMVAGKYIAFVLGDYENGMPFFLKSSNDTLRTLAEHERAPLYTDTPEKKVTMGDEWVKAAKDFKPIYRTFYDRASRWYAAAWPSFQGLSKLKLRERFKKLLLLPAPGGMKNGVPANWRLSSADVKASIDGTIAHNGGKSLRFEMQKSAVPLWVGSPISPAPPQGPATLSIWVASDGTNGANDRLVMHFYGVDGKAVAGGTEILLPMDTPFWQKVETKVDVPKDAVRFDIGVIWSSTMGTMWIDDVSLKADKRDFVENGSFEK